MPRPRKTNPLGLPPRVYQHHGGFRYIDLTGKVHNLGRAWDMEARQKWAQLSGDRPGSGTVAELLDLHLVYVRLQVQAGKLSPRTLQDNLAEAENLKRSFGHMLAAKVSSDHIAAYLDTALEAKRGTRANREIALLSSAYSITGMRKRLVRVNPCYGVRRNPEAPRRHYVEGQDLRRFNRDYASRRLRCYVLLKYLIGLRQADMLKLTKHHLTDRGIEVVLNKSLTRSGRKMRFKWTWALRIVVRAILELPRWTEAQRKKPRKQPPPSSIYLFNTDDNTPLTARGFKSEWGRSQTKFAADGHPRFWEHDIRAKTGSDSKSDQEAQERLGHDQISTARRHYRRGISKVTPLR